MKMFLKRYVIPILLVIIMMFNCVTASAIAVTASAVAVGGVAIASLCALCGISAMSTTNSNVAFMNMYSDICKLAESSSNAMYANAVIVKSFVSEYSASLASSTSELVSVSGQHLSNAINALTSIFEANYITNSTFAYNFAGVGTSCEYPVYLSSSNVFSGLNNMQVANFTGASTLTAELSNIDCIYYGLTFSGTSSYMQYTTISNGLTDSSYIWNGYSGYTAFEFPQYSNSSGGSDTLTLELLPCLSSDYLVLACRILFGGAVYTSTTLDLSYNTVSSYDRCLADVVVIPSITEYQSYLMPVFRFGIAQAYDNSNQRIKYSSLGAVTASAFPFIDTGVTSLVATSTYAPYSTTATSASDVIGLSDIPDNVISGQYPVGASTVGDRVSDLVGASDVIGLNYPVGYTGQDVFNPSIDSLGLTGTLSSDVVIDGTLTIPADTAIDTAIDTAVSDIADVSVTDTVLTNVSPSPPIPAIPDVFPSIWEWFDNLVNNALQWFIFCGSVFGALPTAIKVTFLGGMVAVLFVGVVKKLLF